MVRVCGDGLDDEIVIAAIFAGKFDRVFQQVPNDLLKFRRVGRDMVINGAQVERKTEPFSRRFRGAHFHHVCDRSMRVERLEL